ncbi:MAG TPA: hypothetical protein VJ873_02755, partial [bacterium]|nr:hypothetical protein [bacterium]
MITRRTLLVLADLEDPAIVEKALRVVLDDHLGEGEAKKLVEWVKAGNPAEAYGSQVTPKAAKAEAGTKTPSSPNGAAQAAAPTGTPDFMSQVGSLMAQHELTRKLPIPTTIKDRMFPWVAGLFHKTRGHVQGFGIKNQLFATVLTLLIFLFVGSSLIGWAKRAIRWVVDTAISATYHTTSSPSPLSGQREPNGPAVTMTSPSVSNPPLKEGAGFGDTQGSIPVKAVEKGGVRLLKKSSSKTVKKTNTKASVRAPLQAAQTSGPNTIPSWAQDEIPVAGNFTSRFYGISYSNWADTLGYLKAQVLPNYAPALVAQYFPASLLDKMQKQQLAQYFASSHPPRVVSGQGDSAEILVQGT